MAKMHHFSPVCLGGHFGCCRIYGIACGVLLQQCNWCGVSGGAGFQAVSECPGAVRLVFEQTTPLQLSPSLFCFTIGIPVVASSLSMHAGLLVDPWGLPGYLWLVGQMVGT